MKLICLLALLYPIDRAVEVKDAAGNIIELDLTSSWVTDAEMAHVGRMAHLRRLDLSQTKITDAGLRPLRDLKYVRELDLHYAEYITDDGLANIRNWTGLEKLNLRGARVTSKVFEHIAGLKNLRELDLAFTEINDDGFDALLGLEKLQKLAIGGNRLNGQCLLLLKQLRGLTDLDIGGIQRVDSGLWGLPLTESTLARVGELKQLTRLSIAAATISDRGVDRPGHPEAERSELADLSALAGLANLEYLDLTRQPVTASAIRSISGLEQLRELRLGLARKLDDAAVPPLLAMKGLRRVYLTGSQISPDGLDRLRPLLQGLR